MSFARFLRANAPWLGAGVLLTFLSSFGQTFFISIFAGEIRETFGLSHGEWGWSYTLGTAASAIVMVWAGALTDRYRTRALGWVVLSLLAGACLFMALNIWAALLPLVIFCLRFSGQGMASHLAVVSMSRWFIATRGRALSIATLGFAIGEAILPVSFVALMTLIDWRFLWVGAAVVSIGTIPILLTLLHQERTPQSHAEEDLSLGMEGRHWKRPEVLRHWLFWMMIPALLGPAAFNTAFFFHHVHFAEIKGWDHLDLVALFPLYTSIGVAAMLASGWLLDRFGTPRLIIWYQVPMVGGFAIFALGESFGAGIVGMGLLALSAGMNTTLPNAFWAEFFGTRHLGAIKSMAAAIMVFGSAIGPGVTGGMIDRGFGLETQFLFVAGFFVMTTAFMALSVPRAARTLGLRVA